jgi:hypothetical protein
MRLAFLLITILTAQAQEFIPFLAGGSANGLLNNLVWYVEADQATGDEPPETPNFGLCCAGNNFVEYNGAWGSASGVITNSRTASGTGALILDYDYAGGNDFTVTGWVKLTSLAADQVVVSSWDVAAALSCEYRLRYKTAANSFELEVEQTGAAGTATVSIVPSPAITTGVWFFVAAGFIDTSNTLFITAAEDGGTLPAVTTAALGTERNNNPIGVSLGAQENSSLPDNQPIAAGSAVDAWGYWNEVLSTTKLGLLYAKTPYGSFTP